jgi:hypothetical protein
MRRFCVGSMVEEVVVGMIPKERKSTRPASMEVRRY